MIQFYCIQITKILQSCYNNIKKNLHLIKTIDFWKKMLDT